MSDRPFRYSSRNWFGKASAGLILGFVIAIALSGVWPWAGPGGLMASSINAATRRSSISSVTEGKTLSNSW